MNSSTVSFSSNVLKPKHCPILTPQEIAPLQKRAKDFERKLTQIGVDEFVKQHKEARAREIDIFDRAQFCVADRNTEKDVRFGTPKERFEYLLHKARKYQKEEAIYKFESQVEDNYEKDVETLRRNVENLTTQLKETKEKLFHMLGNKGSIVRKQTSKLLNEKIDALEKFYRESQGISKYHKDVEEELAKGELP